MPTMNNDGTPIQDRVAADILDRKQIGLERYNTLLRVFNGRSSALDAYQEILDLSVYLRQLLDEWTEVQGVVAAAVAWRTDISHRLAASELTEPAPAADQVLAATVDLLMARHPQVAGLTLDVETLMSGNWRCGTRQATGQP